MGRVISYGEKTGYNDGDYLLLDNGEGGTKRIRADRVGIQLDSTLTDPNKAAPANAVKPVDAVPTQGSSNGVSSGGVYDEIGELSEDLNFIKSVSIGSNLIGTEANVLYPVFIPAGTPYVNISTSDGTNFAPVRSTTMKLIAYNANKEPLDSGWTLGSTRSFVDANFGRYYSNYDVYYLSLNVANSVPLMVTMQESAVGGLVPYVPYFLNTQELNGRVNGIDNRLSKLEWKIPAYYESHMESKVDAILALDNVDIQVGFITDEHFPSNAQNSPDLLHYLWEKVPMDFIVNNGDVLTQAESKADAMKFITQFNQLFDFAGNNYFPVIGNHEHDNANGSSLSTQLSLKQVQLSSYSKIRNAIFSNYTAYYFDDDVSKCRYYFIGTKQNSQLYDEDVGWVIHTFLTIPDGYGVIVYSHAGLKYDENYAVTGVQVKINSICNALLALANKASNYHSTIGASEYLDFSTVNAIPVAVFSGHVHFDGYYQYSASAYNGYIYVIATTCDAYGSQVVGSVDRTAGTVNEQAFDVISIDKTNRLITMTRIGGGSDRTFTYSDYHPVS